MKVTIEGSLDQVAETLNPRSLWEPTPRQVRLAENKAARDNLIERRRVVVEAFKRARSADDRENMDRLLEAIRRTGGVTNDDLKVAHRVLSVTNGDRA